jgi:acetyl esterase/lipase
VPTPLRIVYGDHPSQFGELTLPDDDPRAVVVVVHGGFWRQRFGLELGRPLVDDLVAAGYAAWNIEYRRVGGDGGWPATFDDVAAALDCLALDPLAGRDLPLDRVVAVGHSAGGHLATCGVVSQAGVLDLVDAERNGVGNGAATDLLGGGPDDVPDRYALASPVERLPLGVRVVCVHGTADVNVPIRQSERFVAAAGAEAELVTLPGADHFAVIDPTTEAWKACRDGVERVLGPA